MASMKRALMATSILCTAACQQLDTATQQPISRAESERVFLRAASVLRTKFNLDASTCLVRDVAKEFIDEAKADGPLLPSEKFDQLPSDVLRGWIVANGAMNCSSSLHFFDPYYFDAKDGAGHQSRFAGVSSFRECGPQCQDVYDLTFQRNGSDWTFVENLSSMKRHRPATQGVTSKERM
ncbi:hypothetical protein [Sphingomonas sp.]|uniref:hypothetical protein n=1 Tax=Sphingomonas sp. TaxID=28214 RepID=UPI0025E51929|nr:hypothetical protein [Sphingomonas sp.]